MNRRTSTETSTLWGVLRARAERQPERLVYTFLEDGERRESRLTHAQLHARARTVGAALREHCRAGERALLLFPPGLEYIVGFFGCMAGEVIAVPAYPPDPTALSRTLPRLKAILRDCGASVVLTTSALLPLARSLLSRGSGSDSLRFIATDALADADEEPSPPRLRGDDVAFLQYTSGSTDVPRGVVLTHDNLLHNSACIERCFGHTEHSQGVIWLPPYHDMGLIGGIIQPLYAGFGVTLMSPLHFLQRPLRWLEAVSRYGATTSGGPNFAYDLCVRKSSPAERRSLDLRRWDLAFNGAEPVRADTLARFVDAFAPAGFSRTALYPCYGLAEATLIAAGGDKRAVYAVRRVDASALADGQVVDAEPGAEVTSVVSCGASVSDQQIVVVDPTTQRMVDAGRVGEIWVAGPSVARGYWERPEHSARTFEARLADGDRRAYLRTGDLGFMDEGELFVTGRLKDLIVVRGRNYYPQDIEGAVERSHAALRPGCGAVFVLDRGEVSGESPGEARLVVVSEFDPRKGEASEVLDAILGAVRAAVELPVQAIVLVSPRTIPKTSSGKIQRFACRDAFMAATLEEVARWERGRGEPAGSTAGTHEERGELAVRTWLLEQIARTLGVDAGQLDVRAPLAEHGLSSAQAVSLSGDLERWLGRRLPPTLVYAHPTIDALARALAGPAESVVDVAPESSASREPIAIIGIGCRVPGAWGRQQLWGRLCEGMDAVTEVSPERERRVGRFGGATGERRRWGGFLGDAEIAGFDAERFGVSPREAVAMDPQHRLLLEASAEALGDAGLAARSLGGSRVGVFVGICTDDYSRLPGAAQDVYAGTGNAASIAANRISYWLDARGPSLAVDTACSSSLVAVHLACRSLWSGESTLALAGGVNLILAPSLSASLERAGFLASDGRCKAFDARADGYGRGEGVGVVVLKPLSRAQADGDRIHAVIIGSAVGSDGASNGLTAPRAEAQRQVLAAACRQAGVEPREVDYVEAHGTGTQLGDPIEVQALSEVFGEGRPDDRPLSIGSIKSNIGHLEGAAGIAGLIKTALAVSYGQLPPSLHVQTLNPHIPWDSSKVRVQTALGPWPANGAVRRAGVSSFGFGGTNAHVVLEQAPPRDRIADQSEPRGPVLLPISGADPSARDAQVSGYLERLRQPDASLSALAAAAGLRRDHDRHRLAVVASEREAAIEALERRHGGVSPHDSAVAVGEVPRAGRPALALVFSGQGSQWSGMARDLLDGPSVFARTIAQIDRALSEHLSWSIRHELAAERSESRLRRTDVAQPVVFAVQVALAEQLRAYGVEFDAVVGHSVGEVAAAHVAGALSLSDAARLVARRGQIMQERAGRGRMALVGLMASAVEEQLRSHGQAIEIAAINGPAQTVVSGEASAVEALAAALVERDVFCRLLDHDYAFHSAKVDACSESLSRALGTLEGRPGGVPLVSTMTGQLHAGDELSADYWGRQLRAPVRFDAAIDQLLERGITHFVELGPHPTLVSAINALRSERQPAEVGRAIGTLRRGEDGRAALLRTLAALYVDGQDIEWSALWPRGAVFVDLPPLPLRRREHWLAPAVGAPTGSELGVHPLLGSRVAVAHRPEESVWSSTLSRNQPAYLDEHRLGTTAVLPASAYFELALAAVIERHGAGSPRLVDVEIVAPMALFDDGRQVQTVLSGGPSPRFDVYSRSGHGEDAWTRHATGRLESPGASTLPPADLEQIRRRCPDEHAGDELYRALQEQELHYGPSFRGVARVYRGNTEALARLEITPPLRAELRRAEHHVHPALLDAAAQVVGMLGGESGAGRAFVPVGASGVAVHGPLATAVWSHAVLTSDDGQQRVVELRVYDRAGTCVVEVAGLRLRTLDSASAGSRLEDALYRIAWSPAPTRRRLPRARPAATWLLLSDDEVGVALVNLLQARGDHCILVRPGSGFEALGPDRFVVDPARAEDLHQVFEYVRRGDHPPCRGVLHLWSLDGSRPSSTATTLAEEVATLEAEQLRDTSAALHVLRELAGQRWREPPRLWLCTRGAVPLPADAPADRAEVSPAPAGLWGLGRTIAQEHPDLFGGCVDLDARQSPTACAQALLRELSTPEGEPQVAIRGQQRYVARLVRAVDLGPPARPLSCRADASYLVTGGLGELGLRVAQALVERGAARLVLMGRTALPDRQGWGQLEPGSRAARQVAAIRALEASGVSVHLAAVDVGDAVKLREFLATWDAQGWPPIRGVVHLAGVLQDRILMRLDRDMLAAVMHAKVGGAWLLHRLFADRPLEFFALFSSIAAVLGSAGQGNYAAANAVLDALAHLRRAQGRPAHAIDWGPWARLGVARPEQRGRRLASRGIEGLAPDDGVALLARVLAHDDPQVTVARIHWAQLARTYPTLADSPLVASLVASSDSLADDAAGRPDARAVIVALPPEERRGALIRLLVEHVARAVGRAPEQIDQDRPLTSLGLDSLMGIELKNRLERDSGVSISMGMLLAGPTVEQLATDLLSRMSAPEPEPAPLPPVSDTLVTALREEGSRPRLWFVHPGALDVTSYRDLVEALDREQPVSVVRVAELEAQYTADDASQTLTPLTGLARQVAEVIRSTQPSGPYLVGGWSIGGTLAFETARVLHEQGQPVALVALLDAPTPEVGAAAVDYDAPVLLEAFASYLGARAGRVVEPVSLPIEVSRSEQVTALLRWAEREQLVPPDLDAERLDMLFGIWRRGLQRSVRRLAALDASPCALPVAYFRATEVLEAFAEVFPDSARAWSARSTRGAKIYDVPGDHYGMFHGPHAGRLAARLDRAVAAALGRR